MSESDFQNMLAGLIESLIDARGEAGADGDESALADIARDLAEEAEPIARSMTFEDAQLLTGNHGLVVRTADGSEFQISIVQSR